jgi:phosphoribosylformylglycinamidine (FGAM) synthase PurS component
LVDAEGDVTRGLRKLIMNPVIYQVIGILFKVRFIQDFGLFRVRFGQVSVHLSNTLTQSKTILLLKFVFHFRKSKKDIAKNITLEQGKTLVDAEGDVTRGLRKLIMNPVIYQVYVS